MTEGLALKDRFLTRECFQDVLLSCHFVVILISFFRDEHPDLECPLDLTGLNCCERYFSENGSFVQNHHNYTILDMHTNLGHMNRIQEVRATNPDIKFPKRKHNNDFIWDKQFQGDQRKKVCDLRDYPSAELVIEAWKEGTKMAKDLARSLGMHPDGDGNHSNSQDGGTDGGEDDSNKWFNKPMEHIDFKDSLRGMLTEEEQNNLRKETHKSHDDTNADNDAGSEQSPRTNDAIVDNDNICGTTDSESIGDIRHIVNPLLDYMETRHKERQPPF